MQRTRGTMVVRSMEQSLFVLGVLVFLAVSYDAMAEGSDFIPLDSKVFTAAKYDSGEGILVLKTGDGRLVSHSEVPEQVYQDFVAARLKGGYWKTNIAKRYAVVEGDLIRIRTAKTQLQEGSRPPEGSLSVVKHSPESVSVEPADAVTDLGKDGVGPGGAAVQVSEQEREQLENASFSNLVAEAVHKAPEAVEAAGLDYYAAFSGGLLGNRLWYFDVGVTRPGEEVVREVDDDVLSFSTGFNFPVTKHLDLGISFGYSVFEGDALYLEEESYVDYQRRYYSNYYYSYSVNVPVVRTRTVLVERSVEITSQNAGVFGSLSLAPDSKANPFVSAGVYYVEQEVNIEGFEEFSDDDTGFQLVGGVELQLTGRVSLIPSVIYTDVADADETSLSLLGFSWFTSRIAGRLGFGYATEAESTTISAGLMVAL